MIAINGAHDSDAPTSTSSGIHKNSHYLEEADIKDDSWQCSSHDWEPLLDDGVMDTWYFKDYKESATICCDLNSTANCIAHNLAKPQWGKKMCKGMCWECKSDVDGLRQKSFEYAAALWPRRIGFQHLMSARNE